MEKNSNLNETMSAPGTSEKSEAHTASGFLARRITRRSLLKTSLVTLGVMGGGSALAASRPSSPGSTTSSATFRLAAATPPKGSPVITKPTSIRLWTFLDPKDTGPRSVAQGQMIEAFKKKHPNIDVIIEIAPWQTVDQQLLQATAAGKGPDVVRIYSPNLPIQVGGKSIIPLDSFFEYWTKEQREDFLFPQNDTVFDGKKMAFYGDIRTYLLWYRADMLDAKNVKLPHSLDELAEVARELTTDKVVGYAVGLSRASNATSLMEWFIPSLWGLGGELTKPDGTAAFSGEAGVRLLQWLQDLVYKYKVMPVGATIWTADTVFDMTKAGTVAMSSQGTHRVGAARAAKGIGNNLKTAPHPSGKASKPNPAMAAGQTFTMSKDAKDREAAWLFIEHMITPEMGVINAKVAGEMSTRKSSEKDPWFQSEQAADIRQWMAYVKEAGRAVKQDKILALSDFIATAAQEVVGMRVAPQKALDDAAKKWNQEIGRG